MYAILFEQQFESLISFRYFFFFFFFYIFSIRIYLSLSYLYTNTPGKIDRGHIAKIANTPLYLCSNARCFGRNDLPAYLDCAMIAAPTKWSWQLSSAVFTIKTRSCSRSLPSRRRISLSRRYSPSSGS